MPFDGDPLAFYGKRIIEEHHARLLEQLPSIVDEDNPFDVSDEHLRASAGEKIGILGAGVGGLYTALMLDSLGIKYDIIESSGRYGGRLSTHKFEGGSKYDYYDAGAMRYPLPKKDSHGKYKNGIMKRLAELTDYPPLNKGSDPLNKKLIPYYLTARNRPGDKPGFYYFNRILQDVSGKQGSFDGQAMNVSADYIQAGASAISSDVIDPFVRMLINDLQTRKKTGWDVMMTYDSHSVRSYMASQYLPSFNLGLLPQHLPTDVVNWCELLETSTGGYDLGLTEATFSSMAFANVGGTNYGDVDWRCFDGGSETLSNKMADYIKGTGVNFQFHKRVTAIARDTRESFVRVTVNGDTKSQLKYSHVISTLPLPILRTVDLDNAGLTVMQRNALRSLSYGPAVKIAILFKTNWWTTKLKIVGGQSFTDLPIRTIVYPSYGVDSDTPPKVLMASYAWTEDAYRLGALSTLKERAELKELALRNLAEAHSRRDSSITYEYLLDQFVKMDVKDWTYDAHTMGAYADFAPGVFGNLYTSLTFPAAGKRLHFAGEALSTRHGWVVGALDSAWRAVYEYLKVTRQRKKIKVFKNLWGENAEWTSEPTIVPLRRDRRGKQRMGMPRKDEEEAELEPDLLDEHLGLIDKGIPGGVIALSQPHN